MRAAIVRQQKAWASRRGFVPDARGYLPELQSNLFSPLSDVARAAFQRGAGGEILDHPARGKQPGRPAKMRALHSSSALVVNVFDYWTPRDKAVLAKSLGLKWKVVSLGYEATPRTGLPGIPPNLDLELVQSDGTVVAIESKFTEWLTRKRGNGAQFKASYFAKGSLHWAERQLPGCQKLAEELKSRRCRFEYLDAPQLLKHLLGLATQRGDKFSLLYLYFDFDCTRGTTHKEELSDFSRRLDPHLRFRAMSYQQLFDGLKRYAREDHGPYLGYLGDRYFGTAA